MWTHLWLGALAPPAGGTGKGKRATGGLPTEILAWVERLLVELQTPQRQFDAMEATCEK